MNINKIIDIKGYFVFIKKYIVSGQPVNIATMDILSVLCKEGLTNGVSVMLIDFIHFSDVQFAKQLWHLL
jgi:hypothetical protein